MKSTKKKFKNIREMKSFLAGIKKRNDEAIKRLDSDIEKYENLLRKNASLAAEPPGTYRRRVK